MPSISYDVNKCLRLHYYENRVTGQIIHADYRIDLVDADFVPVDMIENARTETIPKKGVKVCPECGRRIIPWSRFDQWLADRNEHGALPLASCSNGVQVYSIETANNQRVQVSLE